MTWQIEFTAMATKQFSKLDKQVKERIINFFENRLAIMDNPKQSGKALQGSLSEYWAYRVGSYRILTKHQDNQLLILVVEIGHRKEVYK